MFKESFYKWTIKQKRRIDPIGDFARDVQLPSRTRLQEVKLPELMLVIING